jgi:hypothetical protein
MLAGLQMVLTGIVADLVNSSRSIQEDIAYRLRRVESDISQQSAESVEENR